MITKLFFQSFFRRRVKLPARSRIVMNIKHNKYNTKKRYNKNNFPSSIDFNIDVQIIFLYIKSRIRQINKTSFRKNNNNTSIYTFYYSFFTNVKKFRSTISAGEGNNLLFYTGISSEIKNNLHTLYFRETIIINNNI